METSAGQPHSHDGLSFALMLVFAMSGVTVATIPTVAEQLRFGFSLSAADLGLLTSVYLFAYGAVQIPVGMAAGRWGGRVLGAGLSLLIGGSLVFAASPGFGGFLAGRALQGLGGGMITPTSNTILARSVPLRELDRAWGIIGSGWGVGNIAALILFPGIAAFGGFRWVFLVTAAFGVLAAAAAFSRPEVRAPMPTPRRGHGARDAGSVVGDLGRIVTRRDIALLGLVNAAGLAVSVGALAWTPSFLQREHGAAVETAAYLTAGLAVAELVATPIGAVLAGRYGARRVILGSLAGLATATALVPLLPSTVASMAAVLLVGFFTMSFFAPLFALVPKLVELPLVGLANGWVNVLGFAGSLFAPWVFGALLDAGLSYVAGYFFLATFALVAGLGVAFSRLSTERR